MIVLTIQPQRGHICFLRVVIVLSKNDFYMPIMAVYIGTSMDEITIHLLPGYNNNIIAPLDLKTRTDYNSNHQNLIAFKNLFIHIASQVHCMSFSIYGITTELCQARTQMHECEIQTSTYLLVHLPHRSTNTLTRSVSDTYGRKSDWTLDRVVHN